MENNFLDKTIGIIESNISNEAFGVSELAQEIGMSRSNLLRKIKKLTNLSVSQFIRQLRLKRGKEILKESSLTVSEVSYQVGFGSTSYFIKCFHDFYGYPPGEMGKGNLGNDNSIQSRDSSQLHQLAAIMFTDIQGYTALMQQDEKKAIDLIHRHKEVLNSVTQKFDGKILKYYGDGALITFKSAIDAVRCGIELQLIFRADPKIPVRIGVHSGDIIFTEDDIIGDGVNVASRIESLSVAGSVFISEKVYDEVKNQSEIQSLSLGNYELKNVGKPIEVFAISNDGLIVPKRNQVSGKFKKEISADLKGLPQHGLWSRVKWGIVILIAVLIGYLISTVDVFKIPASKSFVHRISDKKSIAVLPFRNDSGDSTNVYLINGLMESILSNLQKIKGLRVISRTSVEKYRSNPKTIPEIAQELNVDYFIEGSGQKIGDQILLNIQLIDALADNHLWAEQYNKEVKDIFKLQQEVAKNIANKIEVIITPEEEERIDKVPTEDLIAYDHFLKGLDLFYKGNLDDFEKAISYYKMAIERDHEFARAHAGIAIAYYFLDLFQAEKKYTEQINFYADKALLLDSKLPQSLIAKALYFMSLGQNTLALPYLETALEYNPNSVLVINILSDYYANQVPDTEKYLKYAIKGIGLDVAANDSSTASFTYLHISNAFIQSGFISEALFYIDKSLAYNPENLFSEYVKAYILYARNGDLLQTKELLIDALQKDTTRLDILQEVGKMCYYLRDYESALSYYNRFIELRKAQNLDVFRFEHAKIAVVLTEMGLQEESELYFKDYKAVADKDNSIYRHLSLSMYYSYQGDTLNAIEHLRLFSQESNYHYWTVLFVEIDPLIDNMKNHPEFMKILNDIEANFWKKHERIKHSLKENGLL